MILPLQEADPKRRKTEYLFYFILIEPSQEPDTKSTYQSVGEEVFVSLQNINKAANNHMIDIVSSSTTSMTDISSSYPIKIFTQRNILHSVIGLKKLNRVQEYSEKQLLNPLDT